LKFNGSLRRTLLFAFILIISLLSAINFYSLQFMYSNHRETEKLLDTIFHTTTLSTMLGSNHQLLTNAINYRDGDLISRFTGDIEETVAYIINLDRSMLQFARDAEDMNAYYEFINIQKSVLVYREKSLVLTRQFLGERGSRVQLYDALYELKNLKETVSDLQNDLLFRQSVYIQSFYDKTRDQIARGLYMLIFTVLVLCVFFSFRISRRVSVPIHDLVQKAAVIGSGRYDSLKTPPGTNKEIALLIDSFNEMSMQLKQRHKIERKLQEEEVKNLQMENMLSRSEMKLLQSRINPHFLFNTLHMITTLTQIEEAPQTEQMIASLSNLLRYILKKADQETSLAEELSIVRDYMNIQTARFGSRIRFSLDIEENSIIHGLEPKKGSGMLAISCRRKNSKGRKMLEIVIADDGVGMDESTLEEVSNVERSLRSGEHLGIANTIRRLELLSPDSSVSIESTRGKGTTIQLLLPAEEAAI
jgi:sensor histidine kinase YesM